MKIFKKLTKSLKKIPLTSFPSEPDIIQGGIIALLLILSLFTAPKLSAEIIIADDFTVTSSGFPVNGDVNLQIDNGRQTGTAAPLEYVWWNGLSGNATPRLTSGGARAGICSFDRAVSMNLSKNFTDLTNGFSIEFDLIRFGDIDYGTSIGFGKAYAMAGWQHNYGLDIVFNRTAGVPGYFISDNAFGEDLTDTGPTKGYFQFPKLAYETNPTIRVKICILNDVFPATNFWRFSLFLNGQPYPAYTNGLGSVFSHTITSKPTNNYIVINQNPPYDEDDILDPIIAIDNFTIATLADSKVDTTAWSDDISSGISSSKIYTHAINFGAIEDTVINGVVFSGSESNLYGGNWKLVSASSTPLTGPFSSFAEGKAPSVSGASLGLVSNFIKAADSDSSGGLLISGLTPGLNYKVSLYSFGFETPGGRSSYISTSDGIKFPIIDQDEFGDNGGQLLTYEYTASDIGTFSISTTPITPAVPAWNWFAFCNEVLPPDAPASISATEGIYSNKIEIVWSTADGTEYYVLYRAESSDISTTNFSIQLVSNSYYDAVPAITYAQDYYYWVQACNTGGSSSLTGPAYGFTKSENPPDTPNGISPSSLNIVTSPVKFVASEYNDNGGFTFNVSQWQVSESPVFSPLKWDSGETAPATNFIYAPQNKVSSGTNFWRVRYMNNKNTWSDWSNSNQFICVAGEQKSGIFKDNFNVISTGDVNTDYVNTDRQSGTFSPLPYAYSGMTEIGGFAAYPGKLMLGQNAGCSPNASFESSPNFKIEFDAEPHLFDGSGDWLSCAFGKENNSNLSPISPSGLGAVFFTHSAFQLFEGEKLLGTSWNVPTNEPFHVTITGSSDSIGESDPAYCSVFINGMPITILNDSISTYSHTMVSGFVKNYITLFSSNGASNQPSLVDNFSVKQAPGVVTVHPWTDDSDSLIIDDSSVKYTHLVNLSGDDVTINQHQFIGTGILTNQGFNNGDPHYTTSTWALVDAGDYLVAWTPDPPTPIPVPNLSGGSSTLGQFGVIGIGSPAVVLSGLTPNSSNTIYIYSFSHDTGSEIIFPSSCGGTVEKIDVDQYGSLNGIIIQYDYIADEDGNFSIAAVPEMSHLRFFICGFANRETGVSEPQLYVDNLLAFGETPLKTLPLEIANIGGGIVDGTISGILSPFSLATNLYYAVPGTNDSISVTFSPTEERDYTNIITLTGNGGTAEVTLIGSGIPEPGIIWIAGLLGSLLIRGYSKRIF